MRVHFLLCGFFLLSLSTALDMVTPTIVTPTSFTAIRQSGNSILYKINLPSTQFAYSSAPLLLNLRGTRRQIGFDYAALLHNETQTVFNSFLSSVYSSLEDQLLINMFLDYCWDEFLSKYTPQEYLDELAGMAEFHSQNTRITGTNTNLIAQRYLTIANLPADAPNIISMLEQELEGDWPEWLKETVNGIISLIEKILEGCDAYGVWGTRTTNGLLFSSRNLDWNSNTGIDQYKLVVMYHIAGSGNVYSTLGFASGLGALAGINSQGVTVSEMNLDNSQVTFSGMPFPLRLRYILEHSSDLKSAVKNWVATNNTNSFNFLIGSGSDAISKNADAAYALETILGYTAFYGANSPVEKAATFPCPFKGNCSWTNLTGNVPIGSPLPEAVWRTNHAFDPMIMHTQEPLFNDTVFRYNLMRDLFSGFEKEKKLIDDFSAVSITATLGTKGKNFVSCDPSNFKDGENILSVTYAPGPRDKSKFGYFYVAWEQGGSNWRPAACNPYVLLQFDDWMN